MSWRWWDLQTARKTRTLDIATGLPRARAQPGRSHRGGRHRRTASSWSTCAPEPCERQPAIQREPELAAVQPGRKDRRVDEPRRDRHSLGRRSATALETLRGHSNAVQQPVFSPDGKTLYTVSTTAPRSPGISRASAARAALHVHARPEFSTPAYDGHPGRFSPDGRLIAVGLKEQGIASGTRGAETGRGAPPRDRRRGQGARLLAGRADAGGRHRTARLHDLGRRVAIAAPRGILAGHPGISRASASARTGRRSRRRARAGVMLWDAATGRRSAGSPRLRRRASDVRLQRRRRASRRRVSDRGGEPRARSGTWRTSLATWPRRRVGPRSRVLRVALSPDGASLALGGFGEVVRLWDVRTGKLVHELDQGGGGALTARVQPRRPHPRHLRLRSPPHPSGTLRPGPRSARAHGRQTHGR